MPIGCECFGFAAFAHKNKTDRVTERICLVGSCDEQIECFAMEGFIDPRQFNFAISQQPIAEFQQGLGERRANYREPPTPQERNCE